MSAVDSTEALATREALKDIIRFWLDMGCDGYRVDMADSLVKNDDENKSATAAIWRDIRNMLDHDYPEAALVSEWSNPVQAINGGGFHMDFYLDHHGNGYNTLLRDYETEGGDNSYFRKDGEGDITRFLNDYLPKYNATKENGYIAMFTCNHDTPRPARTLSDREMKLFAGFLMTMPGVPFVYYGDEIGMRYLDVRTKEGGYHRTGSRTPMQWDTSANYGFSKAEPEQIYLPQDSAEDAPVLSTQKADPDSLYNTYKALIAFRHSHRDLQADGDFQVILGEKGRPFVYQRGGMMIVINPSQSGAALSLEELAGKKAVFVIGSADTAHIGAQSFAVFL
jgi:maltose alpha-D-glucosyltransferase/alpha-amylase